MKADKQQNLAVPPQFSSAGSSQSSGSRKKIESVDFEQQFSGKKLANLKFASQGPSQARAPADKSKIAELLKKEQRKARVGGKMLSSDDEDDGFQVKKKPIEEEDKEEDVPDQKLASESMQDEDEEEFDMDLQRFDVDEGVSVAAKEISRFGNIQQSNSI